MYEFTIDKDIDKLDDDDLRETFEEFMQKHEDNVSEYESLREELTEYDDVDLDDLEKTAGKVNRIKKEFADKAGEYTNLGKEYALENFSLEKNIELAAKYDEAESEEEESETEFEEREERGRSKDDPVETEFDEEIEASLDRIFS